MKDINKIKQGRRNRINGSNFERLVRKDLESKGWIVSKWQNNIETGSDKTGWLVKSLWKMIPSKASRFRLSTTGFPDFIVLKDIQVIGISEDAFTFPELEMRKVDPYKGTFNLKDIIFVECKINGTLSKEEKEKVKWYLENNVCSKFLVASKYKEENRIKIKYEEFN